MNLKFIFVLIVNLTGGLGAEPPKILVKYIKIYL